MHAIPLSQFSVPPLPTLENVHLHPPMPRMPAARARDDGCLLALPKLHERLALLAKLELPCTITVNSPALFLGRTLIDAVDWAGDALGVGGQGFNLWVRGPDTHTVRLVGQRGAGDGSHRLEIRHRHGGLYASIQPAQDGAGRAVWQDVMDNPSLSLS